jgi:predicted acyltransferase
MTFLSMADTQTKTASSESKAQGAAASQRLVSVDALRGFDMFWIVGGAEVITRLPGDGPIVRAIRNQLEHADWVGFRFYDLIFPLFLFLVGVSITLSLPKILTTMGRRAAITRMVRRTVVLYLLGIFMYGGIEHGLAGVRLLGVLQRIAICYFAAALLFCFFRTRGLVAWFAGLLIGYWALMTFVPVPGLGAGHFEKGANLANYIDSRFLPLKKWDGTWDPEGLLSTLPAIATCLFGVLAGLQLRSKSTTELRKVLWLVAIGVISVVAGYVWGLQFPVIKKIWTSSYVLVAGGYSCLLLALFLLVVDIWKFQLWCRPFVWIGANAITIYVGQGLVDFGGIATRILGGPIQKACGPYGEWMIAVAGVVLMLLTLRFLYQRGIFLKV